MRCASIRASELFHPGNNPGLRMDAGHAMQLAAILSGDVEVVLKEFEDLFSSAYNFRRWLKDIRALQSLREVEMHIATAFTSPANIKKLSPVMWQAIKQLAKKLCEQQANLAEREVEQTLQQVRQLKAMAAE